MGVSLCIASNNYPLMGSLLVREKLLLVQMNDRRDKRYREIIHLIGLILQLFTNIVCTLLFADDNGIKVIKELVP